MSEDQFAPESPEDVLLRNEEAEVEGHIALSPVEDVALRNEQGDDKGEGEGRNFL